MSASTDIGSNTRTRMPGRSAAPAASATMTITESRDLASGESVSDDSPPTYIISLQPPTQSHVHWDEKVINNEGMGKRKSKKCCIFHKKREFDESSSSSDEDDEDDEAEDGQAAEGKEGNDKGGKPVSKSQSKKNHHHHHCSGHCGGHSKKGSSSSGTMKSS